MTTTVPTIPTHVVRVVTARRISKRFRRVTFGGLERFHPVGPDQFVYVLMPPPGRDELTIDESFRWTDVPGMPESDRPVGAYYTVRHHRPEAGEVDCDFFLHEPAGVASAWATQAVTGRRAALWGPRTAWDPPIGIDWWLLIADETGLPATAAILESLGEDAVGRAFLEVDADGADYPIPAPPGVQVTWLRRSRPEEPGLTTRLLDAVRDLSIPTAANVYAWGGAEARAVTDVRHHLRRVVGLDRTQVSTTRYWRHPRHAADPVVDD